MESDDIQGACEQRASLAFVDDAPARIPERIGIVVQYLSSARANRAEAGAQLVTVSVECVGRGHAALIRAQWVFASLPWRAATD